MHDLSVRRRTRWSKHKPFARPHHSPNGGRQIPGFRYDLRRSKQVRRKVSDLCVLMEIRYRSTMIDADKEFEKLKANKDKILAKLSEMGMADESRF